MDGTSGKQTSTDGKSKQTCSEVQKFTNLTLNSGIIFSASVIDSVSEFANTLASLMMSVATLISVDSKIQKTEVIDSLNKQKDELLTDIKSIRNDLVVGFKQQNTISKLMDNPAWNEGFGIVEKYNFDLPKITEVLTDEQILAYVCLLKSKNSSVGDMLSELMVWMSKLAPSPGDSSTISDK